MEDEYDDIDEEVDEEQEAKASIGKKDLKDLRAAAKRGGQAAKLEREIAFLRAGIDSATPLGQLIVDGYKGELEVDKIKEFVAQLPQTQTPEQEEKSEEREEGEEQSTQERQNLGTGARSDDGGGVSARDKAKAAVLEANQRGVNGEDALGSYVATIAKAAHEGDTSVIVGNRG